MACERSATGVNVRVERVVDAARHAGWRVAGPDLLVDANGAARWLLHPPTRREWSATGCLVSSAPVDHTLRDEGGAAVLRCAAPSELDVVELSPEQTTAMAADASPPLTVTGSFAPLGPPRDLAAFLVGGEVLDTTDFGGRRCPSEQTALSIFRIARWRGGPFWSAIAEHIAEVVSRRVANASGGLPAHDLDGRGESHTRFVADAALLLMASGRVDGARRVLDGLATLAVDWLGAPWFLHDTHERSTGANHLVLNTHLHAITCMRAADEPVGAALRAADRALALRPPLLRGAAAAGLLGVTDRLRAHGRGHGLAHRAQETAARARARRPHLRLPGGWLARDVGLPPAPSYFTVDLSDLAVLERAGGTPRASFALRSGLRWAALSGHFAAQRADGDPLAVLVPTLLRNAGRPDAAKRAADAVQRSGWAPAIGWPGYEDHLWPELPPGTP